MNLTTCRLGISKKCDAVTTITTLHDTDYYASRYRLLCSEPLAPPPWSHLPGPAYLAPPAWPHPRVPCRILPRQSLTHLPNIGRGEAMGLECRLLGLVVVRRRGPVSRPDDRRRARWPWEYGGAPLALGIWWLGK